MNDIPYIGLVNSHTKCYRCYNLTEAIFSTLTISRKLGAYDDVFGFHEPLLDIRADVIV